VRNISFSMTTQAFKDRRKTVTRRLGWWNLKAGDILMAVEKGQGLKKGEKVVRLGAIKIISAQVEPLSAIRNRPEDCIKEGFPDVGWLGFIRMFRAHNNCALHEPVNRIEFEYL
jgi:hypothetical protein